MKHNSDATYADFLKNLSIPKFNEMQTAFVEKAASVDNLMLLAPTGSGKTLGIFNSIGQ